MCSSKQRTTEASSVRLLLVKAIAPLWQGRSRSRRGQDGKAGKLGRGEDGQNGGARARHGRAKTPKEHLDPLHRPQRGDRVWQ